MISLLGTRSTNHCARKCGPMQEHLIREEIVSNQGSPEEPLAVPRQRKLKVTLLLPVLVTPPKNEQAYCIDPCVSAYSVGFVGNWGFSRALGFQLFLVHPSFEISSASGEVGYVGVSANRGPEYSTPNSRILILRTPKQGTLNFRKLPC